MVSLELMKIAMGSVLAEKVVKKGIVRMSVWVWLE